MSHNLCDTSNTRECKVDDDNNHERATEKWEGGENHVVFLFILLRVFLSRNTARYRSWAELVVTKKERETRGGPNKRKREKEGDFRVLYSFKECVS